ncbi:MAG: hypothetical protein WEB06_04845 [Actinomycetota bacterium]
MKMEEHFKETLNRAVANEPPVLDAWDRFERRVGRSRRRQMVAGLAGAAAVIVAAVIVVPQLGTGGATRITPPIAPPAPYVGWSEASDPIGQWTVKHPLTWRVTHFEGVYEVLPPGEIGTAAGEPTFAVTIARLEEDLERSAAEGAEGVLRGTWGGGRPYMRIEQQAGDGSVGYFYRIDWRPPCAFETPACDIAPSTLVVHVFASDQARFDKYSADGELVARSITYMVTSGPSTPASS